MVGYFGKISFCERKGHMPIEIDYYYAFYCQSLPLKFSTAFLVLNLYTEVTLLTDCQAGINNSYRERKLDR